jgi:hypothetical protein
LLFQAVLVSISGVGVACSATGLIRRGGHRCGQGPIELAGDAALEAASDLFVGAAFGGAPGDAARVVGQQRIRVAAMVWIARSPPELRRCRTVVLTVRAAPADQAAALAAGADRYPTKPNGWSSSSTPFDLLENPHKTDIRTHQLGHGNEHSEGDSTIPPAARAGR